MTGFTFFPNRKYDEIVSVNDIPVTDSDLNLVKSLLDGAIAEPTMVRLELVMKSTHISRDGDLNRKVQSPFHFIFVWFLITLFVSQVLKRPVGSCQISFDLDLRTPKKSKSGMFARVSVHLEAIRLVAKSTAFKGEEDWGRRGGGGGKL